MLGSLFRSTFKQTCRSPLFLNVPKQPFANAATQTKTEPNQANTEKRKWGFFDPKVTELSTYVPSLTAQRIKKVFKNCDYETEMLPALNLYKEYGFNDKQLKFLFNKKPSLLRLYPDKSKNDVAKHCKFLVENYNFSETDFRTHLLRNPWIMNISHEELQTRIEYMRKAMGMTHKEIRRLLIVYPTTFNSHPAEIGEKIRILQDFVEIPARTIGIIAARFPFFLRNKTDYLRENVKELVRREFSKQQIISILKRHSEAMTVKPSHFQHTFYMSRKGFLSNAKTAEVYTQNPRFFTIDVSRMMIRKIKGFKRMGVSRRKVFGIMRRFPRVFIKSYGSLMLKMKYLKERMEITLTEEKAFPMILNFNYANIIRPRGELMISKKNVIPWVEVLQMKDEEFVNRIGATLEELNELKQQFKTVNNELDYKYRFFSRYWSNSGANAKY